MKTFEISRTILKKIVVDDTPFALALRNAFKNTNIDNVTKGNVTALIGCELRHQLVFDNLIERFLGDANFEDTIYLRFFLANHLFLKRFKDDELLSLVNASSLNPSNVKELIDFVNSTQEIIPNDLDKSSPEFLSMRFNTPSWIIKMWQKQYGKGLVFKLLKCNYHQSVPSVRIDTNKISKEDFLSTHPDFISSPVEDVLIFQGRGTPKNVEEFKDNRIFFMKMGTKYIIDHTNVEPMKKIAIFAGVPNNIYLDIIARFGDKTNLDIITSHTQNYYDNKKVVDALKVPTINLYRTEAENIQTCISSPVDTFFCLPASSCLDLLRSTPDYFLRIKQEKLDEIIAKEKLTLEECAKLVNYDGSLVYMVPTLSKKESTALLGEFLVNHPEFELIEERQFFPFDSFDSCLYFAIMKKKGEASD